MRVVEKIKIKILIKKIIWYQRCLLKVAVVFHHRPYARETSVRTKAKCLLVIIIPSVLLFPPSLLSVIPSVPIHQTCPSTVRTPGCHSCIRRPFEWGEEVQVQAQAQVAVVGGGDGGAGG